MSQDYYSSKCMDLEEKLKKKLIHATIFGISFGISQLLAASSIEGFSDQEENSWSGNDISDIYQDEYIIELAASLKKVYKYCGRFNHIFNSQLMIWSKNNLSFQAQLKINSQTFKSLRTPALKVAYLLEHVLFDDSVYPSSMSEANYNLKRVTLITDYFGKEFLFKRKYEKNQWRIEKDSKKSVTDPDGTIFFGYD